MSADSRYSPSASTIRVPPPKKHSALSRKPPSSAASASMTTRCRVRDGLNMQDTVPEAHRESPYELALFRLHAAGIDETPVAFVKMKRLLGREVMPAPVPAEAFEVLVCVDFDELLVKKTRQALSEARLGDGGAPTVRLACRELQCDVLEARPAFTLALIAFGEPQLFASHVRARRGTPGCFSPALHGRSTGRTR